MHLHGEAMEVGTTESVWVDETEESEAEHQLDRQEGLLTRPWLAHGYPAPLLPSVGVGQIQVKVDQIGHAACLHAAARNGAPIVAGKPCPRPSPLRWRGGSRPRNRPSSSR